ncbi:MAG TPA: SpoIIE family protein phosphatase [Bacteroidia bacterium]|nr:SpoIIE family protein phosphatase [Bacteroidia bacterium]
MPDRSSFIRLSGKRVLVTLMLMGFCTSAQQKEIDSLENLVKTSSKREEALIAKAELTLLYFEAGREKDMEKVYTQGLAEALAGGYKKAEATFYHKRGSVNYYSYKLDTAIFYFKKAFDLRKQIGDFKGALRSVSNLASIYFVKTDYKTSLELFNAGLQIEAEQHFDEGEYIDLKNMAIALRYLRMYNKALTMYRKCLKLKNKSASDLYTIYWGMALVYKEKKMLDSAWYYENKSHQLALQINDPYHMAFSYSNLATVYSALGKRREAMSNYRKALKLAQDIKDSRLEMASYANIGELFIEMNRVDSSDIYLAHMVDIMNELKLDSEQEDISRLLAEYFYRKKMYDKSYHFFRVYSNFRDSIYNLQSTANSLEWQEKYESDKKQKENELLQVQNRSYKSSRNYLLVILGISFIALLLFYYAYRKILNSRKLLARQRDLIEENRKEILDSINYARRIQFALLASDHLLRKNLPEHFVLFKPKTVVSGDFYWALPADDGFVYITGDCTGHGVPGAFMSLLFITKLNQAITEFRITRPDLILNHVRDEIIKSLNPEGSQEESKDGMDAVVCKLDLKGKRLEYSAANNAFYIIRRGQLLTFKADKMPVGKGMRDSQAFTFNEVQLESGDVIYTFTDGFADQFGGPEGKKYKYKQFEHLLMSIHRHDMDLQKKELEAAFENWKGKLEQVDDVCVIGVKIT